MWILFEQMATWKTTKIEYLLTTDKDKLQRVCDLHAKNEITALLRADRKDVLCAIPLPKCSQNLPRYIRNQTEDNSERWREEAGQLGNWGPMQ